MFKTIYKVKIRWTHKSAENHIYFFLVATVIFSSIHGRTVCLLAVERTYYSANGVDGSPNLIRDLANWTTVIRVEETMSRWWSSC